MSPGDDIDVMLVGSDIDDLQQAADAIKAELQSYSGVYGISDSFLEGKEELQLGIKPAAEGLGLSLLDLGRQVRQAFYGEEAQRIQRGRRRHPGHGALSGRPATFDRQSGAHAYPHA